MVGSLVALLVGVTRMNANRIVLIGMLLGFTLMVLVFWIFRRSSATKVDKIFRRGQLFSAAAFSLGTDNSGLFQAGRPISRSARSSG